MRSNVSRTGVYVSRSRSRMTCFGRFGGTRPQSTAVFASEWWLMAVTSVELEQPTIEIDLRDRLLACREGLVQAVPGSIDTQWVRAVLPVGMQMAPISEDEWPL